MPAVSPIVHAQSAQVGIGERESRRYWGQQLVVRGQLHSPLGKLVMRVAHVAPIRARCFNSKRTSFHVALELEHVESVDLRSEVRKADAVLPVFARAGQRSDTLKRVARRGRCRLLFRLVLRAHRRASLGAAGRHPWGWRRIQARRSTCLLLLAVQRRRVESLVLGALSSSPVHRALVLVLGTNIAVLLDCSSRLDSVAFLTYLLRPLSK